MDYFGASLVDEGALEETTGFPGEQVTLDIPVIDVQHLEHMNQLEQLELLEQLEPRPTTITKTTTATIPSPRTSPSSGDIQTSGEVSNCAETYRWTITGFRRVAARARAGQIVESPLFRERWFLILFPRGESDASAGALAAYLCKRDAPTRPPSCPAAAITPTPSNCVSFAITAISASGGRKVDGLVMRDVRFEEFENGFDMWGGKLGRLRLAQVLDASYGVLGAAEESALVLQCEFLHDDELARRCVVRSSSPESSSSALSSRVTSWCENCGSGGGENRSGGEISLSELHRYLGGNLLNDAQLSDVAFEFDEEDEPIWAHKLVLATRSPVFREMFRNKASAGGKVAGHAQSSSSSRVFVQGVSREAFKRLLRYLYTGRVMVERSCAAELFVAADKYMVKELKRRCELVLKKGVTAETVLCYYKLGVKHNGRELKTSALNYMRENAERVLSMPEYEIMKIEDAKMASEIEGQLGRTPVILGVKYQRPKCL